MSENFSRRPSQREIDAYMIIHGGNRHDRKHTKTLAGEYTTTFAKNVSVIKRTSRFTGEYIGEGDLSNWDWIGELRRSSGETERPLHHKDGDKKFNMVTLNEYPRLSHPQHEEVLKKITAK